MRADQMKFYLYRSKNKIDMLHSQLEPPDKSKRVKWKIDLRVISRETDSESNDDLSGKLERVLQRLDEEGQIGSPYDDLPYVRATLPVRWGLYEDDGLRDPATGTMVYFGHTSDDILLGMAGSSFNVEGMYGVTSTRF